MIEWLVSQLGPWNWMVLGWRCAIEIVTPGFYLLWIGLAALVVGADLAGAWDTRFLGVANPGDRLPGAVAGRRLCRLQADGWAQDRERPAPASTAAASS